MINAVDNIICSSNRASLDFTGDSLHDALCFGFSYIESEDHIVNYIVANNTMMKNILTIPDAVLDPSHDSLGELWTAKLLISNKLGNKRIIFSNASFSAIVNINLNKNLNI
jgi:hypothetical protein